MERNETVVGILGIHQYPEKQDWGVFSHWNLFQIVFEDFRSKVGRIKVDKALSQKLLLTGFFLAVLLLLLLPVIYCSHSEVTKEGIHRKIAVKERNLKAKRSIG